MKFKVSIAIFFFLFLIQSCSTNEISDKNTDITIANKKTTGTSAHDLLSDDTFTSMVIEVVYVEGYAPTQTAINNFVNFIKARTYKPNGVSVQTRSIVSPGESQYSIEDIRDIEDANRTAYNTDSQIAVWAFFTDGESDQNTDTSSIIGTAYRNTSFVIFENTVHDFSNNNFEPPRDLLETTVIEHEFCHILGLTNFGSPMQSSHEDLDHEKHCNVDTCLMYWASEFGSGIGNMLGSSSIPQLDSQCLADLQANGGK
ncbi:membrane metalloprotease [Gaetbulibacter sp. M235]|uniref:membrane metalloprotease n=1 Tax=Gaetbulibacter sp. M235 TaxID=3126510 RepID=UPI00374ECA00